MTRFAVFLFWLLHFLPDRVLTWLGHLLGRLLYLVMGARRHITLTNLALCFPELTPAARSVLARRHFALYGVGILERTVLWWGSEARIRALARVDGLEHIAEMGARPVILFSLHFVGMDLGWTRLSLEVNMCGVYAQAKNKVLENLVRSKRARFGQQGVVSNKEGLMAAVALMKSGKPFMYLPDMDFGRKHSIFVPYFGVQAATLPGLSRLARATGAAVVPVITRLTDEGWVVTVESAWTDFPTRDLAADTRRMNAYIEAQVREIPEQYWWTHRRFKTRPPGEPSLY